MPTIPQRNKDDDKKADAQKSAAAPATVVPGYHSPAHYITEPDKNAPCSRYFVRRWMPLLGENGVRIVLALRILGFYNWKTDERRDGIEIELPELAALVGVSVATLKREFADKKGAPGVPQNPALRLFVQKEQQYWRDPVTNRLLRTANVYRVMMDDPIHEDDLPRLQEILASLDKNGGAPPKAQNAPQMPGSKRGPKAQNEPQTPQARPSKAQSAQKTSQSESNPTQSDSEMNHSESPEEQNEPALKDSFSSPHPLSNSSPTPVAPRDSHSLFEDDRIEEEDRTAPSAEEIAAARAAIAVPPKKPAYKDIQAEWDAMTPEARERFRAGAVREYQDAGTPQPLEAQILPTMFKHFWKERTQCPPA